ncbi:MAG: SDR family oxidoreductase [Psychroflexus halocasei]
MNIENKIAVITGASKGLGKACTEALISKNAIVYGIARSESTLIKMRKKLGDNFIPVVLDLTDEATLSEWISDCFSKEKSPDILINNAGYGVFQKIENVTAQDWSTTMNVNLNATFLLTSKLVKLMKNNQSAKHIINIGSILGQVGRPEGTAYCTTKFGIQGFSEALSKELRYDQIKVTCVNPGSIATDFFQTSGISSHNNMLQPNELANTIIHLLETPNNMLISDLTVRPLNPKKK